MQQKYVCGPGNVSGDCKCCSSPLEELTVIPKSIRWISGATLRQGNGRKGMEGKGGIKHPLEINIWLWPWMLSGQLKSMSKMQITNSHSALWSVDSQTEMFYVVVWKCRQTVENKTADCSTLEDRTADVYNKWRDRVVWRWQACVKSNCISTENVTKILVVYFSQPTTFIRQVMPFN